MMAKQKQKQKEKPKYDVKGGIPKKVIPQTQPQMTEEEAFASYANQAISNAILDMEATKTRTVDSIKALVQQLGMYMNAVKKLEQEKKALEDKLKKKFPGLQRRILDSQEKNIEEKTGSKVSLSRVASQDLTTSAPVLPVIETPQSNQSIIDQLGGR